jgi:DNA-binding NtrC family response regulator
MGRSILVVDDDEDARRYLARLLSSIGYEVHTAESGEHAVAHLSGADSPAVVLLDLLMPGMTGLEVLDHVQRTRPGLPVIVQSTVAEIKTVVDAVRRGAADYLTKPFQEQELELALHNVLEKKELKEEVRRLKRRLDEADGEFVTSSPRVRRIKEIARQVANTDAPVLVLGESGVGKEVVARLVHQCSRRHAQPFVKVNCAALPQDLLESELFGYERGAFSGALREKPGMFDVATRGTILLDEIGEMSCHLQAKLLHVLQDGQYTRLGGRHAVKSDARVIASTNIRLEEAVGAGRFRADLYFRLNVVRVDIPPLRERREDIPLLCSHFLRSFASRYDSGVRQLPRELQEAFVRHDWPGNVRELENAVRRFTILPDVEMAIADLERNGLWAQAGPPAPPEPAVLVPAVPAVPTVLAAEEATGPPDGLSLRQVASRAAEEAERKLVRRVLAETKWHRKEAASRLKVSYKALLNKLKRWEAEEGEATPTGLFAEDPSAVVPMGTGSQGRAR